jgi:hypothetical protein
MQAGVMFLTCRISVAALLLWTRSGFDDDRIADEDVAGISIVRHRLGCIQYNLPFHQLLLACGWGIEEEVLFCAQC